MVHGLELTPLLAQHLRGLTEAERQYAFQAWEYMLGRGPIYVFGKDPSSAKSWPVLDETERAKLVESLGHALGQLGQI